MVDLNKEDQQAVQAKAGHGKFAKIVSILAIFVAAVAVAVSVWAYQSAQDAEQQSERQQAQITQLHQQMKEIMCMDLDGDGFCGTPSSGPEQQPIKNNDPSHIQPVCNPDEPQYCIPPS